MNKVVIYIHGKGGNAEESVHYKSLFSDCDVVGLNYTAQFPWEAKKEFPPLFDLICKNYKSVQVIANSIGAYLAMNALSDKQIEKAYFISPVVNMEKLITDMMFTSNVTEDELRDSAMNHNIPSALIISCFGIDGQHDTLITKDFRPLRNQIGIFYCCRI